MSEISRQVLHRVLGFCAAVTIGSIAGTFCAWVPLHGGFGGALEDTLEPLVGRSMAFAIGYFVPPIVLALIIYITFDLVRGQCRSGRETRCRKCGYILRGISEPRCPECGERI